MADKKRGPLSRIWSAVVEHDERYITASGFIMDAGPITQMFCRAETKAAIGMALGVILLRGLFNDNAGLIDPVVIAVTTTAGFAGNFIFTARYDNDDARRRFGRDAIVDLEPDAGQVTNERDILAVRRWLDEMRSGESVRVGLASIAVATASAMNAVVTPQLLGDFGDVVSSCVFMGAVGTFAANPFVENDRCRKIIEGEYVVLEEKPEKQTKKTRSPIESLVPEPQPGGV